jgi:hypothetical protein
VVVVAEDLVAESGRAALVAGGVDVAAACAGLSEGGFELVLHVGIPSLGKVLKYSNHAG